MTIVEKRKLLALALKEEGLSCYEISRIFNVHIKTVQKYFRRPNERILELNRKEKSVEEIAEMVGVNENTVRLHLKQAGIPVPVLYKAPKKRDREKDIQAILDAMKTCDTQKDIVAKTGINACAVSVLCREENLWARAGKADFTNRGWAKKKDVEEKVVVKTVEITRELSRNGIIRRFVLSS